MQNNHNLSMSDHDIIDLLLFCTTPLFIIFIYYQIKLGTTAWEHELMR